MSVIMDLLPPDSVASDSSSSIYRRRRAVSDVEGRLDSKIFGDGVSSTNVMVGAVVVVISVLFSVYCGGVSGGVGA